jgi:O-antigen ligase/tetratricopeptide (TPR) repeat protein
VNDSTRRASLSLAACHPLERFCHLLILTTLFGSIFAYPFYVEENLLKKIGSHFPERLFGLDLSVLYFNQVADYFQVFSLPLVLKGTVAAVGILLLLGVWLWWRIVQMAQREDSLIKMYAPLHLPLLLLVIWMAVSLYWTPSFNYSLRTFSNALLSLLFFIIVFDLSKPERLVRKWSNLFLAAMLLVALVSFLQHAWPTMIFRVFPEIGPRNRIASFIGHNTALSAFCLCACYFVIARFFEPRRALWRRGLLGLYALLLLFLIVSAQSRGVWVMAMIGLPLVVWRAARISDQRLGLMLLGAAIAGGVLLTPFQFSDNPLNLTTRQGAQTLKRRLVDFSPAIITKGTRFRILTCSIPLVAARPIHGYGIGSFAYVYPEKQGQYFLDHPDTILQPTDKRTGRAHNDYLQLTIELGFVGLALALWLIVASWLGGWRGRRNDDEYAAEEKSPEQLTYLPIGASCATILVHGLFDFPVHIVCYGLLLAWLGAIWASRGRESEEAAPAKFFEGANPGRMKFRLIALLSLGFASSLLILYVTPWFVTPLQQGVYLCRGNTFISDFLIKLSVLTDDEKQDRLKNALIMHGQAQQLDERDGAANFAMADTQRVCAEFAIELYGRAVEDNHTTEVIRLRTVALSYVAKSLANFERALKDTRFHSLYFLKGRCYERRWQLTGNPSDWQWAIKNLEEAINYTQADANSLLLLDDLLMSAPQPDYAQLNKYRRYLYLYSRHSDPGWASFMHEVNQSLEAENYQSALKLLLELQEAAPGDQDILLKIIHCHVELGELAAARGLIASAMSSGHMTLLTENRCQLMIALSEGDWRAVVRRSRELLADPQTFALGFGQTYEQREYERTLLRLCLVLGQEKMGQPEATRSLAEMEREFDERDPLSLQVFRTSLAFLLLEHFDETERGMALIDQLFEDDQLFPNNLAVLVRYWLKQGDRERAINYFEHLRQRFPRYFLISQLEQEVQLDREAVDDHLDSHAGA